MDTLTQFLRKPRAEKWLRVNVLLTLGVVKLGLLLIPFRYLYQIIARYSRVKNVQKGHDAIAPEEIISVINRASRRFLGANSCFPQALTGKVLLEKHGYPVQVKLGVRQAEQGILIAHAWVEKDGEVILGGPKSLIETYTPLSNPEKALL